MSGIGETEVLEALRRSSIYRALAGALAYPRPGSLADVAGALSTAAESPSLPPAPREALIALAAAARAADPAEIEGEYVFLFDRQVRCPPYEGGYGDAAQLAGKGAALADVAGFYAAFGLEPSAGQADTEDHIVAELEFMSALALKEAWALGEDHGEGLAVTRQAQIAFLTDHLGRWAAAFAEALAGATPLPYYRAGARALAAWVERDLEALGATPRRLPGRLGHDPLQDDTLICPMAPEPASGDA
jgi:TorA maturation chaperone TorD